MARARRESPFEALVNFALLARTASYAPYSRCPIGAALLARNGRVYQGTNVENASLGLSMCAERNALCNAVTQGERDFVAIAVAGPPGVRVEVCGACQQVLFEFAPNIAIIDASTRPGRQIAMINLRDRVWPVAMKPLPVYDESRQRRCFISYNSADRTFAESLARKLRALGIEPWIAPGDMKTGDEIEPAVRKAIQMSDAYVIVLSSRSMNSRWVRHELGIAWKWHKRSKRVQIAPIALCPISDITRWQCFHADDGIDLAQWIRQRHVGDFSHWKTKSRFEDAAAELAAAIKARRI